MVHLPRHDKRLSSAELNRAREICEQIKTLFSDRATYIEAHDVLRDSA